MEFSVGGEEADAFFPVKVSFIGVGSMIGLEVSVDVFLGPDPSLSILIQVDKATRVDNGEETLFSQETTLSVDEFVVV